MPEFPVEPAPDRQRLALIPRTDRDSGFCRARIDRLSDGPPLTIHDVDELQEDQQSRRACRSITTLLRHLL